MTTLVPDRTDVQREMALLLANEVRSKRAVLKRDVKAGRVNVLDVIESPPAWALSMTLFDLLVASPKLGSVKVTRLFTTCRVSLKKTLGGLTCRQRDAVTEYLIWRTQ